MVLRRIGAALATLGLLFLFVGTLPASADSTCPQKVVDTTAKSVLNIQQVETAANQLASVGADVYVRSFETTPNGSIDAYYRAQVSQCSNWQSPDGKTPKGNLILVAFGMDHTSAIFYGSNWHMLDGKVDSIRSNTLNTSLKSGAYTTAVASTLTQLASAVKAPASNSASSGSAVDVGAVFMVVLYVVCGIIVLALLIFAGRRLVRAYDAQKSMQNKLQKAKSNAVHAQQEATDLYNRLMNGPDSKTQTQNMELQTLAVPVAETKKFEVRLQNIQKQLTGAVTSFTHLNEGVPELATKSRSLQELTDIRASYVAVRDDFAKADQSSVSFWKELDDLNHQLTPEGRQESLAQLQVALDNDSRLLASITAFDTAAYQQRLDKLSGRVQSIAQSADVTDDNWTTYQAVQKLTADEATLAGDLQNLEDHQKEIRRAPQELAAKLARTKRLVDTAQLSGGKAKKFNRQLASLEQSIAAFEGDPERSVDQVRRHKDGLHESLDNVASACESEQRKARSYASSGRSSRRSDDSFGNGMLGGYLGASLANNDSSSSSSSSSSDYGGGSSGGWDSGSSGGSFDFGGGSSGGW